MTSRRHYTQELLKARKNGRQVVVSTGAIYPGPSKTREWPVVYRPRHTHDARPWLELFADGSTPPEGTGMRWSGRQCAVESRFIIQPLGEGAFKVWDLLLEQERGRFSGEGAYRKAELYQIELNRADRRLAMGLPTAVMA